MSYLKIYAMTLGIIAISVAGVHSLSYVDLASDNYKVASKNLKAYK